jgi:voltage-gated potassium channel
MSQSHHKMRTVQARPSIWHRLMNPRPIYLTISLFVFLLLSPTFSQRRVGEILMNGTLSLILVAALVGLSRRRLWLLVSFLVGLPWLVMLWIDVSAEFPFWAEVGVGVSLILFFLILFVEMIVRILGESNVTTDTIARAVSAYLLLGIVWMGLYAVVHHLDSEAFVFTNFDLDGDLRNRIWRQFLYFSYVTLTTLGYGDITPVSPAAQALVMVECILGPMYMTILVARLVALYDRRRIRDEVRDQLEDDLPALDADID